MSSRSILVDCCALADLFVGDEQHDRESVALRREFPIWYSPPLIQAEFGNVLRTQIRAGNMTEETGLQILAKAMEMVVICDKPPGAEILKESNASQLTFYDATYVATARLKALTLYTRDKKILANCAAVARSVTRT